MPRLHRGWCLGTRPPGSATINKVKLQCVASSPELHDLERGGAWVRTGTGVKISRGRVRFSSALVSSIPTYGEKEATLIINEVSTILRGLTELRVIDQRCLTAMPFWSRVFSSKCKKLGTTPMCVRLRSNPGLWFNMGSCFRDYGTAGTAHIELGVGTKGVTT